MQCIQAAVKHAGIENWKLLADGTFACSIIAFIMPTILRAYKNKGVMTSLESSRQAHNTAVLKFSSGKDETYTTSQ